MRRQTVASQPNDAYSFDVRRLETGDAVEVFDDDARAWLRGTYRVTTAGEAQIELRSHATIRFDRALASGIRPLLH